MPEDSYQIYSGIFSYLNQISLFCFSQFSLSFCCFLTKRILNNTMNDVIDVDDDGGDFSPRSSVE